MNSSYQVLEEIDCIEVGGKIRLVKHVSGARILSVENNDTNKVFAASFKTPVSDSTGVAHILEHMVLNGSKKYPTKEPFVDLIKTSLKTFLNAFTFPDKTVYPVASENEKDFYNLVGVYLDAVFDPLLLKQVFMQEGWRYEYDEQAGWHYAGVVFNEMKGSLASADRVFGRLIEEGLFAGTNYEYESGGDPEEIINLTHEGLVDFHKRHYNAANGWFMFWGDDPWDKRMQILEPYLSKESQYKDNKIEIKVGEGFREPKIHRGKYAVANEAKISKRNLVGVYWRGDEIVNYEQILRALVVNHLLLGNSGSVLRKTLMESGLGSGLVAEGVDTEHKELVYGVGLRDVAKEDFGKFEDLVMGALVKFVDGEIKTEWLEAAINSIEFSLKEEETGSMPRGLEIFLRSMNLWLHDQSPLDVFAYQKSWNKVKQEFSDGQSVKDWIRKNLINNSSRVRIELLADVELAGEIANKELGRINDEVGAWSEDEKQLKLLEQAKLIEWQSTPDSVEQLATLPRLSLADVRREVKVIPSKIKKYDDYVQIRHELETKGIGYVNLAFDVLNLDMELMPWLSVWVDLLDELGTKSEDYGDFNNRIDRYTGGVNARLISSANYDGEVKAYLIVSGKALDRNKQELMDILSDMLFNLDWSNRERVRQVVAESIGSIESELLDAGHIVVRGRLAAKMTQEGRLAEEWRGVNQLKFLRELLERIENDWGSVYQQLQSLGGKVIGRKGMIVDYSYDDKGHDWISAVDGWVVKLPTVKAGKLAEVEKLSSTLDVLSVQTSVNYVGIAGYLPEIIRKGAFGAVVSYVGMSYLWENVRMKGGAYGAMLFYEPLRGIVYGSSYRDPQLLTTWKVYEGMGEYLAGVSLSSKEIEQIAIGVLAEIPQSVGNWGYTFLTRYISGWTDARRQVWRDEIMSLSQEDFKLAGVSFENWIGVVKCVLCSDKSVKIVKSVNENVDVIELV